MSKFITCTERRGAAVVEISNPPVNVLTMALLEELRATVERVGSSGARGLLLCGTGKCFSAGADVAEHLPPVYRQMLPLFSRTIHAILGLEIPTLACVHGAALGGGLELALACDFIVAAEPTRLGFPEITLGVFPPVAAAILPLEIGSSRALDLLLSGETINASRALELGLINKVGSAEDAAQFLERMVRFPRPALSACKRAARRGFAERMAEAERIYVDELMGHPEPLEGLKAFIERRKPSWEQNA
ncbi:MAG: enoyl-CoA hydratase/isomerase family protein [Planctomycetes bacterium]|nr:enoyl-CoA hydratase/isomerase family protein [Planctomycetota bacterium]